MSNTSTVRKGLPACMNGVTHSNVTLHYIVFPNVSTLATRLRVWHPILTSTTNSLAHLPGIYLASPAVIPRFSQASI